MQLSYEDIKASILPLVNSQLTSLNGDLDEIVLSVVEQFQPVYGYSPETKQQLMSDLRSNFNTTTTLPGILRAKQGYVPWLHERKGEIQWNHWQRYKYYLRNVKGWSENVINSLDETSDSLLDLLFDPKVKDRPFDRRGMVVGFVQSGKTASFTSLINKAFDAGFQVIIVLAGMHNNLRSQTQVRLDEEVIGFTMQSKTIKNRFVGVGNLPGYKFTEVTSLTNRDQNGDFSVAKAGTMFKPPILLVVKKNKSVLTSLLNYLQRKSQFAVPITDGSKKKVVPNLPLLIIDDEADQATVNTSEIYDDDDNLIEDYNPSAINGLIREIFHTFEQRAYVGYTATPFANVLIDQSSQTEEHGYDLFPRDFILSLPKPSNYVGPAEYFSIYEDADQQQQSLVRYINEPEAEAFMPSGHKKTHVPSKLPLDLVDSVYAYLVATALRRLRGQTTSHSSMLVHVTRFTDVQRRVTRLVAGHVDYIRDSWRHEHSNSEHYSKMKALYECDFIATSSARTDGNNTFTWDDVVAELRNVLQKVTVKEINGNSEDALEYTEHEDGCYVIAVGGDKLSRGLTLEGLTVSYYMRTSKLYDTLMQMGRWFGYRDGYLDLCRIYTTRELANWFYHIAIATEELRAQLLEMAERDETPEDYVLQINVHPDMQVTSPSKMKAAKTVRVSYSADLVQTTVFENSKDFFAHNFRVVEDFIESIGEKVQGQRGGEASIPGVRPVVAEKKGYYFWENTSSSDVLHFLERYKTTSSLSRVNTASIRDYILERNRDNELVCWTVVLVNGGTPNPSRHIAGLSLNSGVKRKGEENYSKESPTFTVRVLTSEGHEFLDYTKDARQEVDQLLVQDDNKRQGKRGKASMYRSARAKRDPKKGLLLLYPLATDHDGVVEKAASALGLTDSEIPIGFAISFPMSEKARGKDYIVNRSVEG